MQKRFILSLLTFALGIVFIFSGYIKLFPIEPFELNFVEQGFLNWTLAPFASRFLIALEIFLGVMLLVQLRVKFILKTTMYLLAFFTVYLIYAILKDGNTGNCGCFGTYLQMTPLQSIIKNIILFIVSFFLFKINDEKESLIKGNLLLCLLLTAILPINLYFAWIPFLASTLNFIVLEGLLIYVSAIQIVAIKYNSKPLYKLLTIFVGISAVAIPFAVNPPDLFVIETYDFGKLNYSLKGEKLNEFTTKKIDKNWKEGKKIIAFLSLTCPHCRDMAFKLHIIKKQQPQLNILFVYGGNIFDKNIFLAKAKCADMPAIDMTIEEMVKISGPFFPTVVGINNGNVIKKWSVATMTENEALEFFD
jgi:hypothetical protein